jgi:hypothetical protein
MADREYFTVEDVGYGDHSEVEYPNYEEALKTAQGDASDSVGPLLIVRWTRTEMTRLQREISVKSEDMTKAAGSKTP